MGGWTTLTAGETLSQKTQATSPEEVKLTGEEFANTSVMEIGGRYHSATIVKNLALEMGQFNKWNPGFDKSLAEGKKYPMRIEKAKMVIFETQKKSIRMESVRALLEGTTPSK